MTRLIVQRASRRLARWRLGTAVLAVASLAAVGAVASPAYADGYPSWQDVQNAKANEATAAAQVTNIQNLISQLQTQVAQTQAEAEQRGKELQAAQDKLDAANERAYNLQAQATASQAKADAATTQAGRLAAQLYRSGGSDLSVNLFLSAGKKGTSPGKLLADLGSMSKLVERSSDIYKKAVSDQNTAKALTAQADVAKAEREKLSVVAADALEKATAAAQAAQGALAAQQANIVTLQAQLAALKDTTATTVAAYQVGEAARQEAARQEAARQEAARQNALAAAAASSGGGGGGGGPGGSVGSQGWAVPAYGPITDGYGGRTAPCSGCTSFHEGADIGARCGAPIYAAHAGVVVSTGWSGGYGNMVQISHGGGISTRYGHIVDGGIHVSVGQQVGAGQAIASVGSTGHSTGCHLHFEVRIGGSPTDPVAYMRARGAPLG